MASALCFIKMSLVAMMLFSGCRQQNQTTPLQANNASLETGPRYKPLADGAAFPIGDGRAERGYLIVAADHAYPSVDTYRLPVAIIRADDDAIQRPPVIMISGGPGSGSLAAAAYPGAYPWVGKRDFVVFGQRGTQHAAPALTCPDYNLAESINDVQARRRAAASCRDRFAASNIDLSTFHTKAVAQDVNALRQALGYDTVALYGLSYGTRVGLTVARDFPGTIDRMVLDSPLPHTVRYDAEISENVKHVLERIIAQCAVDDVCNEAYPDLARRAFERIERAKTDPIEIDNADGTRIPLFAADLIERLPLGFPSGTIEIPQILDAIAREDTAALSALGAAKGRPSQFDWGVRLSVWCSEVQPHTQMSDTPFANIDLRVVPDDICEIWDVPARPASDRDGTVSSVPTLVIAGAFDPATPVEWAARTVETLSNSRALIVPYGHHSETTNWDGDGCAMSIAGDFMDRLEPDIDSVDIACISQSTSPIFKVSP